MSIYDDVRARIADINRLGPQAKLIRLGEVIAGLADAQRVPGIREFAPIIADGARDESGALKAAHDAAKAAGARQLYIPEGVIRAPSAANLGDVIFVGPGKLSGTYRKRVIPVGTGPRYIEEADMVPALHLTRFARAAAPIVVIMGDSTSTSANTPADLDYLWPMLCAAIRRDNNDKTITFTNRGIGGTTYTHADTKPPNDGSITFPSWYADPVAGQWLTYVQNAAPDLLFLNFGTNDAAGFDPSKLLSVVAKVQAWAKIPDIVFLTNLQRSNMADADERTQQEARDYPANWIRSYCSANNFGLTDLHRASVLARDGYDPLNQASEEYLALKGTTQTAPSWVFPEECTDFELDFTVDNTSNAIFGGSKRIEIKLRNANNLIQIFRDGSGNFGLQVYYASSLSNIYVTTVNLPGGAVAQMRVTVKGNTLSVYGQNALVYEGPIIRFGGLFVPEIRFASPNAATPFNFTINSIAVGRPQLAMPIITDAEMWGDTAADEPFGGNNINHPSSRAVALIHGPTIDRANFASREAGLWLRQDITAAAAINARASHVRVTGPAASTYAITLAAPAAADSGRVLVVEMIATTATNSVTLALTNVVGGSAANTATFTAAGHTLILVARDAKWVVIKEVGVALT